MSRSASATLSPPHPEVAVARLRPKVPRDVIAAALRDPHLAASSRPRRVYLNTSLICADPVDKAESGRFRLERGSLIPVPRNEALSGSSAQDRLLPVCPRRSFTTGAAGDRVDSRPTWPRATFNAQANIVEAVVRRCAHAEPSAARRSRQGTREQPRQQRR